MAWFPSVRDGVGSGGSLVHAPDFYTPSNNGALGCFTVFSGDLADELAPIAKAGGKMLMEKKLISEDVGYMGLCIDTEGIRIAFHSRK